MNDIANYCKIHGIYDGSYIRFEEDDETYYAKVFIRKSRNQECRCGNVVYRMAHTFDATKLYDYIFNHNLTVVSKKEVDEYIKSKRNYN